MNFVSLLKPQSLLLQNTGKDRCRKLTAPKSIIVKFDRSKRFTRHLKSADDFQGADVPGNHGPISTTRIRLAVSMERKHRRTRWPNVSKYRVILEPSVPFTGHIGHRVSSSFFSADSHNTPFSPTARYLKNTIQGLWYFDFKVVVRRPGFPKPLILLCFTTMAALN